MVKDLYTTRNANFNTKTVQITIKVKSPRSEYKIKEFVVCC